MIRQIISDAGRQELFNEQIPNVVKDNQNALIFIKSSLYSRENTYRVMRILPYLLFQVLLF